jgi:hypothetical protein
VLDRLISGAGALTDRADRLVRALTSGRGPDVMGNRPGSVLVIVILIVGSVVFGLLALESADNPTPRAIAPAEVASADDIGRRVYATIEGIVADNFVETFPDDDGDGIQDEDETGDAWYYFLIDESGRGVTVRSTRNPVDIYRYTATGIVVRDPEYVSVDVTEFGQLDRSAGIELDDTFYLDASTAPAGSPQPLDLSAEMPSPGTAVTITGPYIGWLDVCSGDADGDGQCEESEFDAIDAFIAHPGSGRAITVLQADQPEPVPVQFTGMLRNEAASIRDAKTARDLDFDSLGITVSNRYLLDDQATPASAGLSLGLAILAGLLAAVLAVGLVGGYLVFRRSKRPLPSGGRTLGPGDEIAVRVTGALRREDGLIHVREAKGRLLRFALESPAEPVAPAEPTVGPAEPAEPVALAEPEATPEETPALEPEAAMPEPEAASAAPEAPVAWEAPPTPAIPSWSSVVPAPPASEAASDGPARRWDVPTTLIVERFGKPEGVALGKGELKQLVSGRVMPFRGPRPAIRLQAGTGTLLLSFDSKEARDRAAAELIGEAGLLIRDTGIAASPG